MARRVVHRIGVPVKKVLLWALGVVGVLIAALVGVLWYLKIPSSLMGMSAHSVCSGVFVAGRDADDVFEEDVLPASGLLTVISVETDPERYRPVDVPEVYGSAAKFGKQTGWKPQIPFEQTLQDTLDYWRAQVAAGEVCTAEHGAGADEWFQVVGGVVGEEDLAWAEVPEESDVPVLQAGSLEPSGEDDALRLGGEHREDVSDVAS